MKSILFAAILGFAALGVAHAAQAAQATQATSPIVDTAYVQEAIKRGAIIWDTRSTDAYKKGHIPGAVNIGDIGKTLRDDNSEDYIAQDKIEKLLSGAGIDPAREIVVYGAKGNPFVYFGYFTVAYFGGRNAHVYHGGIDDWHAAGQAISTEDAKLPPVALHLKVDPGVAVSTKDVLKSLKKSNVQIVDVRTPKEYSGEDIRAIRGGHIPGAVNIPYEQNWVDPETPKKLAKKEVTSKNGLSLKPVEELKALYAKLDPDKETIVYCQSGVRASETATVLQSLGFKKVKVYDSSWLGYGNTLSAPATDVSFFNVGAMNGRMAAMESHIEALEKLLAAGKQ
ncbi:MAG: sulfurtransferase [Betaproteobacteria bacterium]|nr:sulfurtransferase [Betaproteobacteria bacterium]